MKANLSEVDRGLRLIAGLVILATGFFFQNYLGLIGLVLVATSAFSFCPLYSIFKISTKPKDPSADRDVIS